MTHNAKVLAALSRISDLRAKGYEITCTRIGGRTSAESVLYTLVSSPPLNATTTGHGTPREAAAGYLPDETPAVVALSGPAVSRQSSPLGTVENRGRSVQLSVFA